MGRKNSGKPFEYEMSMSLRKFSETHMGAWWIRYPDYQDFAKTGYRAPRAPADFISLYRGTFYAIECKSTRSPTSFAMRYFKPHQKESLLAIKEAGGEAYVAINQRRRPFKCWFIDISDYLLVEDKYLSTGRKSIPFVGGIDRVGFSVRRLNVKTHGMAKAKKGWNLGPLFERRESLESYRNTPPE
jgi:penicillin-binding protein-related factor A (putative recombinase)